MTRTPTPADVACVNDSTSPWYARTDVEDPLAT
jgi:hypothetical protein